MHKRLLKFGLSFSIFYIVLTVGCGTPFKPRPVGEVAFKERMQTQVDGNYRVKAAVLSAEETEAVFGFALYKKGIQPIWLEIENKDDKPTWFLPFSVDPDYFPPLEVTYPYHRTFDQNYNDRIDRHFLDLAMGLYLAPGSSRAGFVFTNLELGTKSFNLDLVGDDNLPHTFTFFIPVPGMRSDHEDVDFNNLYSPGEMKSYTEVEFRKALQSMPCCTANQDGTAKGASINVVFIAGGEDLLRVLIRSGWNETASSTADAATKKKISSQIPDGYRYEPLERLYYFGRPQDASFREPRLEGFERNKLRLWLSPMRFEGKEVWVGQVSREYGKRSSGGFIQKLDLDEVRSYLIQDLWYAQGLRKFAFVRVKDAESDISRPKQTFRGTTYITDGYVVIIWLAEKPISLSDVELADWELPPEAKGGIED